MTATLSILGIWLAVAAFVYWQNPDNYGWDDFKGSILGSVACLWWVAPIMWMAV